jgi:hypothetical protein
MATTGQKGVPARMLVFFSRAVFMRQRQKQSEVERVLRRVGRDSSGPHLSRAATSWAGGIGDRAEPNARGGYRVGNPRREPVDPSPKVFPNEVARASGRLLRWDGKSRNSVPSAIPWVARVANSGGQTLCPAELGTGYGFDGHDLSNER